MKKRIMSVLLTTTIFWGFASSATAVNLLSYKVTLHSNSSGTLLIGSYHNEIYTKEFSYSNQVIERSYDFKKKVTAYNLCNDKIYVLYPSDFYKNKFNMSVIENGKIRDLFNFYVNNLANNCKIYVDSKENFYIYNSKKQIDIYNNKGEFLTGTKESFLKVITLGNNFYGVQNNKISLINSKGIGKTYPIETVANIFGISENYLGYTNGKICKFNGSTIEYVMTVEKDATVTPCKTTKYIVSSKDNCLIAYDKISGKIFDSYKLQNDVYDISSYKDKITVVYTDNSVEFYNADDIFVNKAAESTETKAYSLSENEYDKDIIFIQQGTTAAKFKETTSGNVEFMENISGPLGTGDQVKINNKIHTIAIKGDVTGEGNINSRDLNTLLDYLLEIELLENEFLISCDMNNDNKISNEDLVLLSRAIK